MAHKNKLEVRTCIMFDDTVNKSIGVIYKGWLNL